MVSPKVKGFIEFKRLYKYKVKQSYSCIIIWGAPIYLILSLLFFSLVSIMLLLISLQLSAPWPIALSISSSSLSPSKSSQTIILLSFLPVDVFYRVFFVLNFLFIIRLKWKSSNYWFADNNSYLADTLINYSRSSLTKSSSLRSLLATLWWLWFLLCYPSWSGVIEVGGSGLFMFLSILRLPLLSIDSLRVELEIGCF